MTVRRHARALADTSAGNILASVDIAVPPARVFAALTTDELTKWWGADLYTTTKHTIDLRIGGAWRSDGVGRDNTPFYVEGEVLELDPPHKLVQTWKPSWGKGPPTIVTYLLEAIDIGTRVTVRHTGFTDATTCDGHATGWERVLTWLGDHVQPMPRYYVCKLVPPRPTFMADMTADERAAMFAHASYWREKLADGVAIAFGPVADASGGYGLGIIAAADDAALAAFQAADPVIVANIGMRYETAPFVRLVY